MSKYEKHLREYTVVGATAVFQPIVSKGFVDFYGGSYEIISMVKDGFFYHCEIPEERLGAARQFLKRVSEGKVDLEYEYNKFSDLADKYLNFIEDNNFSLETIIKFFNYYKLLINTAVASMDCIDVIDELPLDKQQDFLTWAEKTRKKEEPVYKNGEMVFMPKYLDWLSKNYLKNYSAEELRYLVCTELVDFVEKNKDLPSPADLRDRKKLFYIRQYPVGGLEFFAESKAQEQIDLKKLDKKVDSVIQEFKGVVAFIGKVSGSVRIIRSLSDMSKFKEGEVLVASMTEPAYLPIMKKASAFITDEGGMLCHAAIVARELKKPCIIATKIATEVLKDGDMVEVDAENGIVKKLSS
ncbi:MAG: PEP-utilizing enzyme [Candidatus Magasanikbacteria bacterium]|nr:PEP-utilizing enzyme [Candidatus Magasanikbacteria bacterium]